MKRFLSLLLAMCMTFSVSFTVACGDDPAGNGGHTHTWGDWTSNGDGTHSRTCSLDASHKETKICSGTDVCSDCGANITPIDTNVDFGEVPDHIDVGTFNREGVGKTVINIVNFHGGIGSVWIDQAAERYAKIMANASYATGKKGVYIKINKRMGVSGMVAQAATSVEHIFFAERNCAVSTWGSGGLLLNLDDVVKDTNREGGSLEGKFFESSKAAMTSNVDGERHYYALPHYEFHGGASYNREVFDEYGAYFADLEKCNPEYIYPYESRFGTSYFIVPEAINEDDAVKSAGPDGISGTEDDGLPVSFEQLVELNEFFKVGCEVSPYSLSGQNRDYMNYFIAGLWASLAGQEQMLNYHDFDGKVEIVTGYTNEPIMQGIEYIKKPTTEWVDLDCATGYKASMMVARYYAIAMGEIATKEGYLAEKELSANTSHLDAQKSLIYGGKATKADNTKVAMLMEASYWYNESEENLCLENYVTLTGDTHEVDLRHMALPTAYTTTQWGERLTQEEYDALSDLQKLDVEVHRASALVDIGQAYCMVNNNIKDNSEIRNAVMDFLKFLYSENELRYFTMETGMPRSIRYDLSDAQQDYMGNFYKRLWNLRDWEKGVNVVYCSPGENPDPTTLSVFIKAKQTINISVESPMFRVDNAITPAYKLNDRKTNEDGTYQTGTKFCFEATSISGNQWRAFAGELVP